MVLGFEVFSKSLSDIDWNEVKVINTINPHSYCVTKKDPAFERALKESDVLLPDGIGIVWASSLLNKQKIKKIAGYDVFIFLMNRLETTKGSCFFLGASEKTLQIIQEKAAVEFPNVTVHSYSPPYKPEFSEAESLEMCRRANEMKPDVLFVGMTAPKQEKWVHLNQQRLAAQTVCSIGAVFDFYAGTVQRPGKLWIKLGLEWLPRFLKEPKRLAERNLVSTPSFIGEVVSAKLFGKGWL